MRNVLPNKMTIRQLSEHIDFCNEYSTRDHGVGLRLHHGFKNNEPCNSIVGRKGAYAIYRTISDSEMSRLSYSEVQSIVDNYILEIIEKLNEKRGDE